MAKFLDSTGLETLVSKMKAYVDSKSGGNGIYIFDIINSIDDTNTDEGTMKIKESVYNELVAAITANKLIFIKGVYGFPHFAETVNMDSPGIIMTGIDTYGDLPLNASGEVGHFFFVITSERVVDMTSVSAAPYLRGTALTEQDINNICK